MRLRISFLAVAALSAALSGPAPAQMGGGGPTDCQTNGAEDLVIPAGVRGEGRLGSFFVTDLWIRATGTGTATLHFHAADSASAAPTASATVDLSQPVTYLADVLKEKLGMDAGFGAIRVVSAVPVAATVRVYNRTGAGAYGLAFMGMPGRMAMTSMPAGGSHGMDEYAMYMLGLLPQPGHRVNVNVVSTSPDGASGVVEILDADGTAPAGTGAHTFPFHLAGYSSHQFNDVLLDVRSKTAGGDTGLQVRVRVDAATPGRVMAYAVVNDNLTNDGYVVMGRMMNGGRGMGGGMGGGGMGGGQ